MREQDADGKAEAAVCRGATGRMIGDTHDVVTPRQGRKMKKSFIHCSAGKKNRQRRMQGMRKSLVISFFSFNLHKNLDVTR